MLYSAKTQQGRDVQGVENRVPPINNPNMRFLKERGAAFVFLMEI